MTTDHSFVSDVDGSESDYFPRTPLDCRRSRLHVALYEWNFSFLLKLLRLMCLRAQADRCKYSDMPDVRGDAPAWVYLLNAVALIVYQTLDALDGKQARRTGTSSPLGMYFDHGCDAVNTLMTSLGVCTVVQAGPTFTTVMCVIIAQLVFFCATMEEYWSGELILPVFNGPNEGIWTAASLHALTAVVGSQVWVKPLTTVSFTFNQWQVNHELRAQDIFLFISIVISLGQCFISVLNILGSVRRIRAGQLHNPLIRRTHRAVTESATPEPSTSSAHPSSPAAAAHNTPTACYALTRFVPILLLSAIMLTWAWFSPADIVRAHIRPVCWLFGLASCKMIMTIMIAHICQDYFHAWTRTMTALTANAAQGAALVAFNVVVLEPHSQLRFEEWFLFSSLLIMTVAYLHLFIGVAIEFCEVLNIHCFSIPPYTPAVEKLWVDAERSAQQHGVQVTYSRPHGNVLQWSFRPALQVKEA